MPRTPTDGQKNHRLIERVTALIERGLGPEAEISSPGFFQDQSGRRREVDILISDKIRGRTYLTAVECRHHRRNVPINYIESIVTKKRDLFVDRYCVLSTKGFSAGAQAKAQHQPKLISVADLSHSTLDAGDCVVPPPSQILDTNSNNNNNNYYSHNYSNSESTAL